MIPSDYEMTKKLEQAVLEKFPSIITLETYKDMQTYTLTMSMKFTAPLSTAYYTISAHQVEMLDANSFKYMVDHTLREIEHMIKDELYKYYTKTSAGTKKLMQDMQQYIDANMNAQLSNELAQIKPQELYGKPLEYNDMLDMWEKVGKKFAFNKYQPPYKIGPNATIMGTATALEGQPISGGGIMDKLKAAIPGLSETTLCPARGENYPDDEGKCGQDIPQQVAGIITHLNDTHKWTREQIADWLETLDISLEFKGAKK